MGYSIKNIEYPEVPDMIGRFPYALIYKISDVILGKNDIDAEAALRECIEARFFGETEELHFLPEAKKAILITDDGNDADSIEKEIPLKERFSSAGSSLIIKQYLESDDDGQCRVALTRLKGIA